MSPTNDEDCTWEFCQALATDEQELRDGLHTAVQCGADPGTIIEAQSALAKLQEGASGLMLALQSEWGALILEYIHEARRLGVGPKAIQVAEKRLAQLRVVARANLEQTCKGTDPEAIQQAINRLEEHGGKWFENDAAPARRRIQELALFAQRENREEIRRCNRQQRAEKRLVDAKEGVKINRPNALAILRSEIIEAKAMGATEVSLTAAENFLDHSSQACQESAARLVQIVVAIEEMLEKDYAGGGVAQLRPALAAELEDAIAIAQVTNVDVQVLTKARIVSVMLRQKGAHTAGKLGTLNRSLSKSVGTGDPMRIRERFQSSVHGFYIPDMTTTQKTRIRHYCGKVREALS